MSFRFGKTAVRVHPLLLLLWAASFLLGQPGAFLGCFFALFLHEYGHWLAARCLKIPMLAIELSPLGGFMTLENAESLPCFHGVLLSAAGPVFSLLGCFLAAQARTLHVNPLFTQSFARASLFCSCSIYCLHCRWTEETLRGICCRVFSPGSRSAGS